jgi:DNA segregation ATPase, ftsK/spoIIIE family
MKVQVNKLANKILLAIYKKGFIWMKLKLFIQINDLVIYDENNHIKLSALIEYKLQKNEYKDKFLILTFYYTHNQSIDGKIRNIQPEIQSLFNSEIVSTERGYNYLRFTLLYKQSKDREYFILEPLPKHPYIGRIELSRYIEWNYVKYAHCLLGGNTGSGKSRMLFKIILELQSEGALLYIADGKFDELHDFAKNLQKNDNHITVADNHNEIVEMVKQVEAIIFQRNSKNKNNNAPVFLIIDEYASLTLLDKKIVERMNNSLKQITLLGRALNVHIILTIQRAAVETIPGAIRDNCLVKVGMGNLSSQNYEMIFNQRKNENELFDRKAGEGYISINYEKPRLFIAPAIKFPDEE